MSLNLDDRQRAMLDAMGVTVWWPQQAAVLVPVAAASNAIDIEANKSIPISQNAEIIEEKQPATPHKTVLPVQVAASARPPRVDSALATQTWPELQASVNQCQACSLCQTRKNTVFGVGQAPLDPDAPPQVDWLIVGEAPGENEDLQGEPFVGQAGKLLDNMLRSLGLARHDRVYIANVLKCRPPGNRNPAPDEIAQCTPYLLRQIELLQPKIILAMGRFAINSLLAPTVPGVDNIPVGKLRGQVHRFGNTPVVVTYHPAYLLRNLPEKAKAWTDLCLAHETVTTAG